MKRCLLCGKENTSYICEDCSAGCDFEQLCRTFCAYKTGCGENELWDSMSESLTDQTIVFDIVDELCRDLPNSVRMYYRILFLAKNNRYVRKSDLPILFNYAGEVIENRQTDSLQKNRIRGLLLDAFMSLHRYSEAEKLADLLTREKYRPKQTLHSMIVFYIRTRRYDVAKGLIDTFFQENSGDAYGSYIEKEQTDLQKRQDGTLKGYVPQGENADLYFAFLESIGFVENGDSKQSFVKPRRIPKPIPRDAYPAPQKAEGTRFLNFVAFDVETTGLDSAKDSIIELSAVKVQDGKIVDRFSRLVRPIDKKLSEEVQHLTGITPEEVADAEEIWQVFPEFVKFIGDDVLVGYNNLAFDSKFLVRAGRYSNIILENPHLDVMHYVLRFKKQLGIDRRISLVELGNRLQIENPQAHRALADAETTAKIYLKLLSME